MWLCVCRLPSGVTETTEWITQDGADQMADETEAYWRRKKKRAACVVAPSDASPEAEIEAAAVAEILMDDER